MTRATLSDVLRPALKEGYAVPGFVCLGWEDARAFVAAAEDEGAAAILQAGPGARAHLPLGVWGAMFRDLADHARVPVVLHLDHARSEDEVAAALAEGFTSIMIDGSDLPLGDNISLTARVARTARAAGASCEGEIGRVGYAGAAASPFTDPDEATRFVAETGVDALAVAVGNVHLQESAGAGIDEDALAAIAAATGSSLPLVIHGGSGIPADQRARLARSSPVCKFNIGTELRQVFGSALRATLGKNPDAFDRIRILQGTEAPLRERAKAILRMLGAAGRAKP
jgi:fructose-bisphosphate aldolase class II